MPQATWIPIVDGILRQTVAMTEQMMQIVVRLDAGSTLPPHQHPEAQITYLVSGRLRFTLGDETLELSAGESLAIPSNVVHAADVLEESFAIDTFSPPRQDMLAQDRAASITQ